MCTDPSRGRAVATPTLRSRGPGRRLVALVFGALLASTVQAQSATALSLDDALQRAQERSRQLPAHEAAAAAALERSVAAAQRPDPTLKAGITNLPIDGPARLSLVRDFMTMRSVGVMQEFTRQDKLAARSARFQRDADVARAGRALSWAKLRRDTAAAWLERHYRERMRSLMQEQRREAELQIEAADSAYRSSRGAQADVFAARSALAQIDDRLQLIEREIASAKTRLARWVGDSAAQLLAAAPDLSRIDLAETELETQLERHPLIELMARQESVARAEVQVAQSHKRSDWSAEIMYSQRGSAYSNMVSISFAIPLQWDTKNRQDREETAQRALAEQIRAEREETLRELLAQTQSDLHEWHSLRERGLLHERRLIPLASERTSAVLAAYRGGAAPLVAVLEARRMEIDTRMERLRLEMDGAALWAQLNYLFPPQAPHGAGQERLP